MYVLLVILKIRKDFQGSLPLTKSSSIKGRRELVFNAV